MTAVASAPSLQPLRRLGPGWNSSDNVGQGSLDSMNTADEVSRLLTSRKGPQRANSSSSLNTVVAAPALASDTDIDNTDLKELKDPLTTSLIEREAGATAGLENGEAWTTRKSRAFWSAGKSEATVATSNGRSAITLQPSQSLTSTSPVSSLQQAARVVPSQKIMQTAQEVGAQGRMAPQAQMSSDPPALLVLLPMNGTFERKQITVPMFPEILRIGRQTNAKTVPTASNGYFDSKVLSRQHAEIWADRNGKIWIRDVKSSNGTFVNGVRLSPESRDSEPHELRENDMLELGIDIVSEDQKSIVHHKVSAKVEHAGISNNTSSVLDLNIADIDPGSGGGLMGSQFLPPREMRGRGLSSGSLLSSSSRATGPGHGYPGFGVQKHMNAWMNPVSIEQVVKRLGNELRQAKVQADDLHRTQDFFQEVLNTEPGKEIPKAPASILPPPPAEFNGVASPTKADPMSPYSKPPAPPPLQPLPEKPDDSSSMPGPLRQSQSSRQIHDENTKAAPNGTQPSENGLTQILVLAETLASTRKELATQGNRVQYLEALLAQERAARENSEKLVKHLLDQSRSANEEGQSEGKKEIRLDAEGDIPVADLDGFDTQSAASTTSEDTTGAPDTYIMDEGLDMELPSDNMRIQELQLRLDLVLQEMDEMKMQMERYKRRAETVAGERDSLAEMVERIRKEKCKCGSTHGNGKQKSSGMRHSSEDNTSPPPSPIFSNGSANGSHLSAFSKSTTDDEEFSADSADSARDSVPVDSQQLQILQSAMATAFSDARRDDRLIQATPYASILGVVLLGVGIMAYLNSWQKAEH